MRPSVAHTTKAISRRERDVVLISAKTPPAGPATPPAAAGA
jgi:hypothetical protein